MKQRFSLYWKDNFKSNRRISLINRYSLTQTINAHNQWPHRVSMAIKANWAGVFKCASVTKACTIRGVSFPFLDNNCQQLCHKRSCPNQADYSQVNFTKPVKHSDKTLTTGIQQYQRSVRLCSLHFGHTVI